MWRSQLFFSFRSAAICKIGGTAFLLPRAAKASMASTRSFSSSLESCSRNRSSAAAFSTALSRIPARGPGAEGLRVPLAKEPLRSVSLLSAANASRLAVEYARTIQSDCFSTGSKPLLGQPDVRVRFLHILVQPEVIPLVCSGLNDRAT